MVQRFAQVSILAVDGGFSRMHFEALAEQIAEDLQANKSQVDLFMSQEVREGWDLGSAIRKDIRPKHPSQE